MRILLVGASGTLGGAVNARFSADGHEVLRASRSHGEHRVDLRDDASVRALFEATGKLDAVVCTAGHVHFGPLREMDATQFDLGLQDKLLGQVRLALVAQHHLNDGGSITLTSGILSAQPIAQGANATAVNAAIEGFVRASACELKRDLRINAVSPNVLQEAWDAYADFFRGFEPVTAARAALAYQRSVDGVRTGHTYRVW